MRIGQGRFRGRRLPTVRGARPAGARLKTSLFSVLAPDLPGARVLDLCAGVGGLGLEALSRGAAHVTFVERDPEAVSALSAWLEAAGAGAEAAARVGDWRTAPLPAGPLDLLFVDPPFAAWGDPGTAAALDRLAPAAAPDARLVLKLPAALAPPESRAWHLARHTRVADVAYAIYRPLGPAD